MFILPEENPIIIDGMISTARYKEIQVITKKSKPILRSINEDQGMEFTWSTWVWINSINIVLNRVYYLQKDFQILMQNSLMIIKKISF